VNEPLIAHPEWLNKMSMDRGYIAIVAPSEFSKLIRRMNNSNATTIGDEGNNVV
jgi:hypothetical protein